MLPTLPTKVAVIAGCTSCPFSRCEKTQYAGYAHDRLCTLVRKKDGTHPKVAGYVEWPSEERENGNYPSFCPLHDNELGLDLASIKST